MSKERIPIIDRPLTSDEINERIDRIMEERSKQDVEAKKRFFPLFGRSQNVAPKPIIDKPLTSDEINERMFRMAQEMRRQEGSSGFWGPTGPIGLTGASEPTKQNSQTYNSRQW